MFLLRRFAKIVLEYARYAKHVFETSFEAKKQGIPAFYIRDFLAETLAKVRAGDFGVVEKTVLHTLESVARTSVPFMI